MKVLKAMVNVIFGTVKMFAMILMMGLIILVGTMFYTNVENSKEDWRNYDVQFDFEDGISTSYTMPVDEIVENTIDDSLQFLDSIVNR